MSKDKKVDEHINEDDIDAIEISNEEPIVIPETETKSESQELIDEYKDMAQRLQAEFDNYRKRNNESVRIARGDGINDVICAIFPILDNFERGLSAITDSASKSGMELIYKQMIGMLKKFDVQEIDALGKDFDTKYHHAIAQCDDAENSNKIVEIYQKGYIRKDKVLRPCMVKVAQ